MLKFCRYNNLFITNTMVGHKMAHKLTWHSRDGKTTHLIHYVIDVRSKDHHLVVPGVNLKRKFRKDNYFPRSYDVGRLQNENVRETFPELLSTILESLKFNIVEDAWNNFRKTICEVNHMKTK